MGHAFFHSGAGVGHDVPVFRVVNEGFDIRPGFAHIGFYRMDGALFFRVEEGTKSVFRQGEYRPGASHVTVFFNKGGWIRLNVGRNIFNIFGGHIGPAKSFAALAALCTIKYILRIHIFFPLPAAWSKDPHIEDLHPWEPQMRSGSYGCLMI